MKKISLHTAIEVYTYEELTDQQKTLIQKAKETSLSAYSPYSKFSVGAAILLENGEIVCGSNQENSAYPSGICAERTAMFYANSTYPTVAPICIAIVAFTDGKFKQTAISPCGACRQVLIESEIRFNKPITMLLYGEPEIFFINSIKDLLPLNFAPSSLLSS